MQPSSYVGMMQCLGIINIIGKEKGILPEVGQELGTTRDMDRELGVGGS